VRPVAIGCKNYLFLGSDHGGKAAAIQRHGQRQGESGRAVCLRARLAGPVVMQFAAQGRGPVARRLVGGAPRSSAVLVEVAGLPGAAKSKTSDLTAMRHFELRDGEFGMHASELAKKIGRRQSMAKNERFPQLQRPSSSRTRR
jgi:hypothetical protein